MKKALEKLLKYDYYIITVVCSLLIICTVYTLQNVAPFGYNSLLTIDFFHQYGPMLAELYNRIYKGMNLVYSFNMGMGLPFFRNFFNYLSSPFNILLLLFKHKDLLMSYSVIIGLKAVASSVTMSIFLNKKFGKNYIFITLSILYAFSAYYTAYYWNIMWLDGMLMLPLIALGIEKLVDENKILLYVISLAVMLFANYFIGYMLCIFSVLYFVSYLIIKTDKIRLKVIGKKILYFALSSLIAGGLCAMFLIPLYMALKGISATGDVWPTSQYYDFTLKEFLFNHFSGVGSTVLKSGITCAPNISCGIVSVALLLIFWMSPMVNLKIKIVYSLFLFFLFASFVIAPLDYIWHAFHVPNDLPYRYSFIYSFILTIISAYGIKSIKNIKPIWIFIVYLVILGITIMMNFIEIQNISTMMIILNSVVITIFFLCYIIYNYYNKFFKYALIAMIVTSTLECIFVVNNNWYIDQNIESFYSDYNNVEKAINYLNDKDKEMFRVEKTSMLTFNDPSWYGYYGQVSFSSMEYQNMADMQFRLGMPGNEINSFYYKVNTPIYDLMFNVKYLIGNPYSNYYTHINTIDNIDIYESNYNAGLMFPVEKNMEYWTASSENPLENQRDFIAYATGINNTLEEEYPINKKIVYSDNGKTIVKYRYNSNASEHFIYTKDYDIDFIFVNQSIYYKSDDYSYIDNYEDIRIDFYEDYNEKYVINAKSDKNYLDIYVGYNYYYDNDFIIYKLNKDSFDEAFTYLNNSKVSITEFKENKITATVNIDSDKYMYTSIPFDDGWMVFVDGNRIETKALSNTLLGFNIPAGDHTIELKYEIPYFKIGLIISILSLDALVLLLVFKKD